MTRSYDMCEVMVCRTWLQCQLMQDLVAMSAHAGQLLLAMPDQCSCIVRYGVM